MKYIIFLMALIVNCCGRGKQSDDETKNPQNTYNLKTEDYGGCDKFYVFDASGKDSNEASILVSPLKPHDFHNVYFQMYQPHSGTQQFRSMWLEDSSNLKLFRVKMAETFRIDCYERDFNTPATIKFGKRYITATIEKGKYPSEKHPGCFGYSKDKKSFIFFAPPQAKEKVLVRRNGIILFEIDGNETPDKKIFVIDKDPLKDQRNFYTCSTIVDGVEEKGAYPLVLPEEGVNK